MTEKQIVKRILEMGAESLNPDMYVELENICAVLRERRKALRDDHPTPPGQERREGE